MSENDFGRENYSNSEMEYLATKFPELIEYPTPSIDQIVSLFLKQHDVEIQPPDGTGTLSQAIIGAITGYYGIEAGATVQVANNQAKIATQQEWTSWKQWALSHAEWTQYKENALRVVEEANAEVNALWLDPKIRKDAADAIEARRETERRRKNSDKQGIVIACLLIFAMIAGSGVIVFMIQTFESGEPIPGDTQSLLQE